MSHDLLDVEDCLDSPALAGLSDQQKFRLTTMLDEYLQDLERGVVPDTQQIVSENADLSEAFHLYLTKLQLIYGLTTHQQPSSSGPQDELPSQQLGDFEIVREIGRGGMGVVYEARQLSMDRRVAIKLLSLSNALDPRQLARFHNESRAAGLLQHPNIVPVFIVGQHKGIHYYAMQLIEGQSIDQWVERKRDKQANSEGVDEEVGCPRKELAWRTIVDWTAQIADALHVAHEAGIVHRDVKPSNLLLDQNGRIWITDFGLARCSQSTSQTASGVLVGTLRYMSPEQASGKSPLVDARADIYGLAVTLYEMLVLHPAIEGDDVPTILSRIASSQIRSLRARRPELPRDLAAVLAKAMSVHKMNRYETSLAFADDLRRVLNNQPTHARPSTLLEKSAGWASRHLRVFVAATLILAFSVVGLLISLSLISAEKRQTQLISNRNAINEKLARDAVDRLGSQMAEQLADIPATNQVRRQLLQETLDYYQRYAANAQDSPDLQRSLAMTLGKIGLLHTELGSHDLAAKALRDSEAAYRRIAFSHPSAESQSEWATSLNNLGQSLHRGGNWQEAIPAIEKAIELLTKSDLQYSPELRMQLASSWNNLGLLLADQGKSDEAEDSYQHAIELMNKIANPSTDQVIQLVTVQTNLSRLLSKIRPSEATKYARMALQNETSALEGQSHNARLSMQTTLTLSSLAGAQTELNQYPAAIESLKQSLDIGEQLVGRWPEHPEYLRALATHLNQLGLLYSRLNRFAESHATVEKALDHQRILAAQFPDEAEVLSTTGSILNNFGFLCLRLHKNRHAVEAFQEAIQFQSEAIRLAPQVESYAVNLRKHQANLQVARGVSQ